jgi:hypothetical protein
MRPRLFAVIVLAVAATLAVPTLATTTGGSDQVGSVVELSPHDGPNGDYASIEDGELRVDFERLNDEARTRAHNVFTVTSTADEPIEMWVETDAGGVDVYEGDDPGAPLDGARGRVLQPGETLPVGFAIETHEETPDSSTVTISVEESEKDTDGGSSGGDGPGSRGAQPTTPTPVSPPGGPDLVAPSAGVEITFDDEGDYANTTVRELDSMPADGPSGPPRAEVGPGEMVPGVRDDGLEVHGTEFVAQQHQPVQFTGSQSYLSTAGSVAREPRSAAILEITPPEELRDTPALVRIRVARDRFPETDPTDAQVGRHTSEGWQLLPTRVVEETEESVVLEARTQRFSAFTVFAESEVDYEWTLPDGRTVEGNQLRATFVDDGPKELKLTVTDAFGRSDVARQEILVNDPPRVSVEQRRNGTDGELTTLRANVTNEYGNGTVTWTLPDGSTTTGESVTGVFESGETVGVTVEDEFGASTTAETTVGVAPAGTTDLSRLPFGFPAWAVVVLALAGVALAAVLARSGLTDRFGVVASEARRVAATAIAAVADDSPRITCFEDPRWNPAADRVEIGSLEVVAPGGTLRAVEITVTDAEGTPVVTRTVELGARGSYAASPEYVPVYGDLELSSRGRYSVEVSAVDDRDRVEVAGRTALGRTGAGA